MALASSHETHRRMIDTRRWRRREWMVGLTLLVLAVALTGGAMWNRWARSPGEPLTVVRPEMQEGLMLAEAGGEGDIGFELTGDSDRSPGFKRWTRYRITDEYELAGRLVAGRKDSKYYLLQVHPKGVLLPNAEQLQEIAESLRDAEYHSNYAYFFLPGMDTKSTPWATVFQQTNKPITVSFDLTNVPALYRHHQGQVLGAR